MQALEEQMHRGVNLFIRDESEDEDEEDKDVEEEVVLNVEEESLFKAISKIRKRPKFEVPTYSRNLNPKELIDWINELEEYFEYEDIKDLDRVKFEKVNVKI